MHKIIEGQRKLTKRFEALASHYLFEPCFARVGEGHDKGAVESRGKAIRLQHLAPVPRGESLSAIAETLIIDLEQAFVVRRNAEGRSLAELWAEELKPRPRPWVRNPDSPECGSIHRPKEPGVARAATR